MRRLVIPAILTVVITALLYGQKEDKEGKAWLDTFAEAAAVNVSGLWSSKDWGRISLSQREGSRKIVGAGDGWEISGVVSGKTVCMLFTHNGNIAYSAKLTAEGSTHLTGVYSKGLLSSNSRTFPIVLKK